MMTDTLVDTCVLLDLMTEDARWLEWSMRELGNARDTGRLIINPIIYAETSVSFETIEGLNDALPHSDFGREELPYEAGFLAGKAFLQYKRQGGAKTSPLPDFYIGAHAAVKSYRVLTRDAKRYQSYFPKVDLIAPSFNRRAD